MDGWIGGGVSVSDEGKWANFLAPAAGAKGSWVGIFFFFFCAGDWARRLSIWYRGKVQTGRFAARELSRAQHSFQVSCADGDQNKKVGDRGTRSKHLRWMTPGVNFSGGGCGSGEVRGVGGEPGGGAGREADPFSFSFFFFFFPSLGMSTSGLIDKYQRICRVRDSVLDGIRVESDLLGSRKKVAVGMRTERQNE